MRMSLDWISGYVSYRNNRIEKQGWRISAHSAIETQRFYRSLGCVDAAQPLQKHVEAEPFDCQLEYRL